MQHSDETKKALCQVSAQLHTLADSITPDAVPDDPELVSELCELFGFTDEPKLSAYEHALNTPREKRRNYVSHNRKGIRVEVGYLDAFESFCAISIDPEYQDYTRFAMDKLGALTMVDFSGGPCMVVGEPCSVLSITSPVIAAIHLTDGDFVILEFERNLNAKDFGNYNKRGKA